jgi:hypothetical protein
MRPLELPISAATSRTVVPARPLRTATASAASTIVSRRWSGDIRVMSRQADDIAQMSSSGYRDRTGAATRRAAGTRPSAARRGRRDDASDGHSARQG